MLQVNIKKLIDDVQWYQTVRELRWPDGICARYPVHWCIRMHTACMPV
jgi:hypothetical protein